MGSETPSSSSVEVGNQRSFCTAHATLSTSDGRDLARRRRVVIQAEAVEEAQEPAPEADVSRSERVALFQSGCGW